MWQPKSPVMTEQGRLRFHGRFVGAAGQIEVKAAVAQVLQQRARGVDQEADRPESCHS